MDNLDADVQHCNNIIRGAVTSLAASRYGQTVVAAGEHNASANTFMLNTGTHKTTFAQ